MPGVSALDGGRAGGGDVPGSSRRRYPPTSANPARQRHGFPVSVPRLTGGRNRPCSKRWPTPSHATLPPPPPPRARHHGISRPEYPEVQSPSSPARITRLAPPDTRGQAICCTSAIPGGQARGPPTQRSCQPCRARVSTPTRRSFSRARVRVSTFPPARNPSPGAKVNGNPPTRRSPSPYPAARLRVATPTRRHASRPRRLGLGLACLARARFACTAVRVRVSASGWRLWPPPFPVSPPCTGSFSARKQGKKAAQKNFSPAGRPGLRHPPLLPSPLPGGAPAPERPQRPLVGARLAP